MRASPASYIFFLFFSFLFFSLSLFCFAPFGGLHLFIRRDELVYVHWEYLKFEVT